MNHNPKLNLMYYWDADKCGLIARNIPENRIFQSILLPHVKISLNHYYDCDLDIKFRFLDPQNITLDTRIVKISHVVQKIWKKVKTFIFGSGYFEKIQYGHLKELIASGTPSKIDHYDLP